MNTIYHYTWRGVSQLLSSSTLFGKGCRVPRGRYSNPCTLVWKCCMLSAVMLSGVAVYTRYTRLAYLRYRPEWMRMQPSNHYLAAVWMHGWLYHAPHMHLMCVTSWTCHMVCIFLLRIKLARVSILPADSCCMFTISWPARMMSHLLGAIVIGPFNNGLLAMLSNSNLSTQMSFMISNRNGN